MAVGLYAKGINAPKPGLCDTQVWVIDCRSTPCFDQVVQTANVGIKATPLHLIVPSASGRDISNRSKSIHQVCKGALRGFHSKHWLHAFDKGGCAYGLPGLDIRMNKPIELLSIQPGHPLSVGLLDERPCVYQVAVFQQ